MLASVSPTQIQPDDGGQMAKAVASGAVTVAVAPIPMALPMTLFGSTEEHQLVLFSSGGGGSGSTSSDMGEENECLSRENVRLTHELEQMKRL